MSYLLDVSVRASERTSRVRARISCLYILLVPRLFIEQTGLDAPTRRRS